MMKGEAVKNHPRNFHPLTNQGSALLPILHRYLCSRNQVFKSLIQHQIQALIFVKLFVRKKFRAPLGGGDPFRNELQPREKV